MSKEELQSLRNLFHKYYLIKRDDSACRNVFAIIAAMRCIETDLAFEEADDEQLRQLED